MRLLGVLLLMGCAFSAWSSDKDAVLGLWQDDRSVLLVAQEGESLSMRIHAVKDPNYKPDEAPGPAGSRRRDFKNPDASLQNRPLLGLDLLVGYAWTGERWEGEIYDPESGNTYKSRMEVDEAGRLSMRGYLGVPMFGRTALFAPAGNCNESVVAMIVASDATGCGQ
jgi:uncharacterized protein (DUF2147 family)